MPANDLVGHPDILSIFIPNVGPKTDDVQAVHRERKVPRQQPASLVEHVRTVREANNTEALARIGANPCLERCVSLRDVGLGRLTQNRDVGLQSLYQGTFL